MQEGILYGVGVGPGDPELMTVKAIRTIENSDVLFLPAADPETCRAYGILKAMIPDVDAKEIICKAFPMTKDPEKLQASHGEIANCIEALLLKGRSVAMPVIGDPAIYSTFAYIKEILEARKRRVCMISGVPSFAAAAAVTGRVLVKGDVPLQILSGNVPNTEEKMNCATRVYLKSGRHLSALYETLRKEQQVREIDVVSVTDCGLETERVQYGIPGDAAPAEYMTLVMVWERN